VPARLGQFDESVWQIVDIGVAVAYKENARTGRVVAARRRAATESQEKDANDQPAFHIFLISTSTSAIIYFVCLRTNTPLFVPA
jgi:hypothetical protein